MAQDASRRVIRAVGEVKATRRDLALFLHFPLGYARRGETMAVDVAARSGRR